MPMKSCFEDIDKYHIPIYKYLNNLKAAKKGIINDYLHKVISPISCLKDKSSEVIDYRTDSNYWSMYVSYITSMTDIYYLVTVYIKLVDSNTTIHKMLSFLVIKPPRNKLFLMRQDLYMRFLISLNMIFLLLIFL